MVCSTAKRAGCTMVSKIACPAASNGRVGRQLFCRACLGTHSRRGRVQSRRRGPIRVSSPTNIDTNNQDSHRTVHDRHCYPMEMAYVSHCLYLQTLQQVANFIQQQPASSICLVRGLMTQELTPRTRSKGRCLPPHKPRSSGTQGSDSMQPALAYSRSN